MLWLWIPLALLALLAVWDIFQPRHSILRNFPLLGHLRYLLELVGPELRQYIVTSNNEERPFSRDQRSWVYASAKRQNNYSGFGSDNEMEVRPNYLVIRHSAFPLDLAHVGETEHDPEHRLPCAKVLGAARGRAKAFRPASVVNISAMSFGSLSKNAIEALNRGAALCGCLHNTGEGGISPWHLRGGELIWQLGTGYFGARAADGNLDLELLFEKVAANPQIRAIEIKLSQGAKPGLGGVLPAKKVTAEISAIRGVPAQQSCISPAQHKAFRDVDEMLDLVETIAERTGLPVGIKSAVSGEGFWAELAARMEGGARGVDFVTVDGGEGGTGAAPLVFADHVALPFKIGFARVYRIFAEHGLSDRVIFIGGGKLGFPETGALALALGCDLLNVAREAMLSIGCIQAQRCHTDHCPTGVATQNRWLVRGLDPTDKAVRLANYVVTLRAELTRIARACGVVHPALLEPSHFEIIDGAFGVRSAAEVFGYPPGVGLPGAVDREGIAAIMGRSN